MKVEKVRNVARYLGDETSILTELEMSMTRQQDGRL